MSLPSDSDAAPFGAPEPPPSPLPVIPISAWQILRVWFIIGIQSFGGGMATLALIQRAVIDERRWVSEAEFARFWGLCQIAPGINLLALTILVSRHVGGLKGVFAGLLGLLLPSVSMTILMTAGYARIRQFPAVLNALHGILPATMGLGLATVLQMARSLIAEEKKEGKAGLWIGLLILAGSGLAVAFAHLPVLLVLLLTGALYALLYWQKSLRRKEATP